MSTQVAIPDSPQVPVLPRDPSSPPQEAEKQRQERRKSYPSVLDYIKNTCKKVETEDEKPRLNILGQQNKCQAYYDDRQYGKTNDRTGEWEETPSNPNYFRPVDNRYKEQVDKLQMEMARSSVDLNVEPVDKTDSAMVEAAEYLKSRVDANRKRLFTQRPEFVLAENMALLLKTITYRYCYFEKDAVDGPKEKRPKFEKKVIGAEQSITVCGVCGAPRDRTQESEPNSLIPSVSPSGGISALTDSEPEPPGPCRQCGSTSIKSASSSAAELILPVGEEEVPSGLPRCVHADPTMVQVSLNARNMQISSSPYLIWTQMVERGKLERMFPDSVIPSGTDTDRAAEYRRDNESSVSNSNDSSGNSEEKGGEQFEKLKFKLIWLDSWVYGDYESQRDEKLPNGQVLPQGTKLIKLFPNGMCIAKVGNTPLALYSEDKNKKWSACVYGLREGAWHGSGTNALLPIQLTINDLLSYRIANVYYNTFTREFIKQGALAGDTLPTLTTVGIVSNMDEGQKIVGNAYDRAPGNPLPPEVPQLAQEQQGSLQEQAGTSSMSTVGTAAQQDGLGTATGIAYMRDMAVGRMGPNLMLKAAVEIETAFQIAELEQNNYSRQQLLAFAGLKPGSVGNLGYTQKGVDAFINSDIRADFHITATPGSWMPMTEQEKKADAIAFADYSSKVQNPEALASLAKALKQPMSMGGFNATQREAARRIEEFGKVVELLTSRGYSEVTSEMAEVVLDSATEARMDVEMEDHAAFIDFYRDWWTSDESRNAHPLLKLAVKMRCAEHKGAMVENVVENKADEYATQIPDKMAEVASNQVDAGQQQVMAEQQAQVEQANSERELANQAAANELQAQDREHKAETDAASREHEAVTEAALREHEAMMPAQ
jgi:hypothetical protein